MDDRVKKVILVLCVADVVIMAALAYFVAAPLFRPEGAETQAVRNESADVRHEDLRALSQQVEDLKTRNAKLEDEIRAAKANAPDPAGGKVPASASAPDSANRPATGVDEGTTAPPGARTKAASKPTWDSLASKLLLLASIAPKDGEHPTPELMKVVGELMGEVSKMQAELGLDDPGFVTESPAFKAKLLLKAMEQAGAPLPAAAAEEFEKAADEAMSKYVEDAKLKDGDFALERTSRMLRGVSAFEETASRFVPAADMEKAPLFKDEQEHDTSEQSTRWPSQSSSGARDLTDAADQIAKNWQGKMRVPESGSQLVRAIALDYVQRSQAAKERAGAGGPDPLTPERRRGLDQEIAGYQVEALKRIYESFGHDAEAGKRIRNYDSLDRFELGSSSSWMRSGSFGGFMVTSSQGKD